MFLVKKDIIVSSKAIEKAEEEGDTVMTNLLKKKRKKDFDFKKIYNSI